MQHLFATAIALASLTLGPADEITIPQDRARMEEREKQEDEWNRRTLVAAYERVGHRDPRWDRPALEALSLAVSQFMRHSNATTPVRIYQAATQAIEAGCDDPMIRYLQVRYQDGKDELKPGPQVAKLREVAAALDRSAYPSIRKALAYDKLAQAIAPQGPKTPEQAEELGRAVAATLGHLPADPKEDLDPFVLSTWSSLLRVAFFREWGRLGDIEAAFEGIDARLAQNPQARVLRLQLRGEYLMQYAWQARGSGYAGTVTEAGARTFAERLARARKALEDSWAIRPEARTAATMLTVIKGSGGDRKEMELWFRRAMEADGDNRDACEAMLDYLDPKWHGSIDEMMAFGRACAATNNNKAGIPILFMDAFTRRVSYLARDEGNQAADALVDSSYNEFYKVCLVHLNHNPADHEERSRFAAYSVIARRSRVADEQFRILGDDLVAKEPFSREQLLKMREIAAKRVEQMDAEDKAKAAEAAKPPQG